eukprot:4659359-Amphidinium_carterae.1
MFGRTVRLLSLANEPCMVRLHLLHIVFGVFLVRSAGSSHAPFGVSEAAGVRIHQGSLRCNHRIGTLEQC